MSVPESAQQETVSLCCARIEGADGEEEILYCEDHQMLLEMNRSGLLRDCILSGPISFDLAVSPDAVHAKGYHGFVAGDADILVFHNIEAGNSTLKAMVHFGDWIFGGVILGARAPIIINSRSDSDLSKLFSIACACAM